MRKNELVYLHSLLVLIRQEMFESQESEDGTFEQYDALGVTPQMIHSKKAHHHSAISALLTGIEGGLSERSEQSSERNWSGDTLQRLEDE
ncbi:UPF0058 family protein [Haloarculaceae archaeon H-GB1-1]|nr:UPF0058 family protein [Haloarculaceae archaeon H-GB1-1]